jgi:hypothetical protein
MLLTIEPMTKAPTPENFVVALGGYVDFARSARPVVADMQKMMTGWCRRRSSPGPRQATSSTQVLGKIVDDLDRPADRLNRPPMELLADLKVIDNILTSTRIIRHGESLGATQYSNEFNRLMTCPDQRVAPLRALESAYDALSAGQRPQPQHAGTRAAYLRPRHAGRRRGATSPSAPESFVETKRFSPTTRAQSSTTSRRTLAG